MPTTSRRSRKDFAALEARRFEAARMFARGESQAAVAKALGVSSAATNHWHHAWKAAGRRGLKAAGRAGRKPQLGPEALARVEHALRAGPAAHGFSTDLWTLPRVAAVIKRVTGVAHHPGHVWKILRKLGWSLQRPARRARERDEVAIARWKSERWPQLKKRPAPACVAPLRGRKRSLAAASDPPPPGRRAARRRS
jgi:transposase